MTSTSTQAILLRSARARSENPWVKFALRRGGLFVLSVAVLVIASFLMIHLVPGDPVRSALGMNAPVEQVEAIREKLGLNLPLWQQFANYVGGLFTGNLGTSMITGEPVAHIISTRLPATLQLAVLAVLLVLLFSVPFGATMAVLTRNGKNKGLEMAFATVSIVLAAIPEFLLARHAGLLFCDGTALAACRRQYRAAVTCAARRGACHRPDRGLLPHRSR